MKAVSITTSNDHSKQAETETLMYQKEVPCHDNIRSHAVRYTSLAMAILRFDLLYNPVTSSIRSWVRNT